MSQHFEWYFPDIKNGHKQGENDGMTDLFSGPTFHALVREALQNSLDAHQPDNDDPVRVAFSLRRIPASNLQDVLSLRNHIEACMVACEESLDNEGGKFSSMIKYLDSVKDGDILILDISDSNTKGMDFYYNEEEEECSGRFDSFFRCSGKPNSGTGTGGSHGYGKTTYFNASKIRCLLVSTMTSEGNDCYFEGVSWLCSHKIGKVHYVDWGFFDNCEGLPLQATKDNYQELIPYDFQRTEPGTTVSIIGVDIEPGTVNNVYRDIKEAVFRNFFVAIKEKRLIVDVDFGDGFTCSIDDSKMPDMLPQVFPGEFDTAKRNVIDRFNPRPYLRAYENAELISDKDTSMEEAVENRKGKTYIKIQDHIDILGDVTFYGYICPEGTDTILYMRSPLMVVYATRDYVTKGFYGLFICDDVDGNDYLKQMENADHKKWEKEKFARSKDTSKYLRAEKIENEMNAFVQKCVQIMFPQNVSEEEDVDIEGFSMPAITEPEDYDSLIGQLVSEKPQNESEPGAPVDVELDSSKSSPKKAEPSKGVAYPIKTVPAIKNNDGRYTGGKRGATKKKKRKDKGIPPFGGGTFDDTGAGKPSNVKESIPVGFRFISDEIEGVFKHTLKINSPCDAENVTIEISAVGESDTNQDGNNLHIVTTSEGTAKGNTISGLTLKEGDGNELVFTLSINSEYSFSLKASGEVNQKTS